VNQQQLLDNLQITLHSIELAWRKQWNGSLKRRRLVLKAIQSLDYELFAAETEGGDQH